MSQFVEQTRVKPHHRSWTRRHGSTRLTPIRGLSSIPFSVFVVGILVADAIAVSLAYLALSLA